MQASRAFTSGSVPRSTQAIPGLRSYSRRAWIVAGTVALAAVLGGGGSPNPATEVLLQVLAAFMVLAWIWAGPEDGEMDRPDPLAWVLVAVVLVIPLVQLVPLPPSVWTALPGREGELASLALVGEESSWRPLSLSPHRTLASLLSLLAPLFVFYGVARLDSRGRRLVLLTIGALALVSAFIGIFQLTAPRAHVSLYANFHEGWVTGFMANRNAEADFLQIGFLALMAAVLPMFIEKSGRRSRSDGTFARIGAASIGLLLLASTVMTGSRAGISLLAVTAVTLFLFLLTVRSPGEGKAGKSLAFSFLAFFGLVGLALLAAAFLSTSVGRVTGRFVDLQGGQRTNIWADSLFALEQYWPYGFGLGGFQPAILAAERLEFVDSTMPNRAHNDFLELGIEAGLGGYVALTAIVAVLLLLAVRTMRWEPASRGNVVLGIGVLLVIGLHSLVDYPLRNMSLACIAGVAAGLLVARFPRRLAGANLLEDGK